MILLTILALTALVLIGLIIAMTTVVGGVSIVIFGDVIVCIVFIGLLIRLIVKRKFNKK